MAVRAPGHGNAEGQANRGRGDRGNASTHPQTVTATAAKPWQTLGGRSGWAS
jgi:hypothetical protein